MKLIHQALIIISVFAILTMTTCLKTQSSFNSEDQKAENSSNVSVYDSPAGNSYFPNVGPNFITPTLVDNLKLARENKEVGVTNAKDPEPQKKLNTEQASQQ